MTRWLVCLVALAGCDALFNLDHIKGVPGDGGVGGDVTDDRDGPFTPDDSFACIGSFMAVCAMFQPPVTLTVNETIDTSNDPRCQITASGPDPSVCIIAATSMNITSTLSIKGTRPIVFAAKGNLIVTTTGVLDASSTRSGSGRIGPAANLGANAGCDPTAGEVQLGTGGGGGGAGGSFGGTGGGGGASDNGTISNSNTALGSPPTALRGGCAGAQGGPSGNGLSSSTVGDSGGAVYLVAGGSISIDGLVKANGSGGGGGGFNSTDQRAGGGGGGSGGMIVIDAPVILIDGIVVAQGGGGGGGAGSQAGIHGDEWVVSSPMGGAFGGLGGVTGASGGIGSRGNSPDGVGGGDSNASGAGGGGGGGGGFILVHGTVSQGSQIYPAPISLP